MSKLFYLIEAPHPKKRGLVGYIQEIDRDGTFDVYMTLDPNEALKFSSRENAQAILDNPNFKHAMGDRGYYVAEHMWVDYSEYP